MMKNKERSKHKFIRKYPNLPPVRVHTHTHTHTHARARARARRERERERAQIFPNKRIQNKYMLSPLMFLYIVHFFNSKIKFR